MLNYIFSRNHIKLISIFFVVSLLSLSGYSQKRLERSLYCLQFSFTGIAYFNHELRLGSNTSFRTEIGIDNIKYWASEVYDIDGYKFAPVLTIEPRYYYNIDKRHAKSIETNYNSANFVSLKASYHPDWFYITNENSKMPISDISIIPSWGMRRQMGKALRGIFGYELGIGIGYRYIFAQQYGFENNIHTPAVNFNVRIGIQYFDM